MRTSQVWRSCPQGHQDAGGGAAAWNAAPRPVDREICRMLEERREFPVTDRPAQLWPTTLVIPSRAKRPSARRARRRIPSGVWFPRRQLAAVGNSSGVLMVDLPHQIGPCQLVELGALVAIRCPSDLDGILRRAGGTWEPGSRRWLLSPARAAKVVPKLRRSTDTLFRRAGLNLDHE